MKKDLDYIAKLEKAIADKYGAETIQNPKSFWSPEKEEEYKKQITKLQDKNKIQNYTLNHRIHLSYHNLILLL